MNNFVYPGACTPLPTTVDIAIQRRNSATAYEYKQDLSVIRSEVH